MKISKIPLLYNIAIYLYLWGVVVASLFSGKVRRMWRGERAAFGVLKRKVDPSARYVWVHAASLGEFEQGRPIIERIRELHPGYKVLLTFFSPSGYEVRKDYPGADIVCYLPIDTPVNAIRFLRLVRPSMAFFIKYEFWYNYLHILKHRGVPAYSVSSIFRPDQVFFRWYAREYANVLRCFTHFYVQNEQSRELLAGIGITGVTVSGDTRFDRVLQIKAQAKCLPIVERFSQGRKVFVAGSSWQPDEDILAPYFNHNREWKVILAPHVIGEDHLKQILSKMEGRVVRYTRTTPEEAAEADCLIIDCYGLLSSVYRYGCVGYVGGGFGVGIHNVLEAAVWGIPVVFGPNNGHFDEARGLIAKGGGFEITSAEDFSSLMSRFSTDAEWLEQCGRSAGKFVESCTGATEKILADIDI